MAVRKHQLPVSVQQLYTSTLDRNAELWHLSHPDLPGWEMKVEPFQSLETRHPWATVGQIPRCDHTLYGHGLQALSIYDQHLLPILHLSATLHKLSMDFRDVYQDKYSPFVGNPQLVAHTPVTANRAIDVSPYLSLTTAVQYPLGAAMHDPDPTLAHLEYLLLMDYSTGVLSFVSPDQITPLSPGAYSNLLPAIRIDQGEQRVILQDAIRLLSTPLSPRLRMEKGSHHYTLEGPAGQLKTLTCDWTSWATENTQWAVIPSQAFVLSSLGRATRSVNPRPGHAIEFFAALHPHLEHIHKSDRYPTSLALEANLAFTQECAQIWKQRASHPPMIETPPALSSSLDLI